MINTASDYIENVDTFAAIELLIKEEDPFQVTSTFNELIGFLYWEKKDLPSVIAMGRAGIQYGLTAARDAERVNPEAARDIRLLVRKLAFNVASYAWPGWGEEGIEPNESDVAFGYDSARLLLRMAIEMEAEPLKLGRAWWMLGIYQLAAGKNEKAAYSFTQSAEQAEKASVKGEQLLAQGFSILARAQAASGDQGLEGEMAALKSALEQEEYGPDFIGQLDSAARVFGISI